jgi:hypothetical protein
MNSSQLITGQSLIAFALAVVIAVFLMLRTLVQSRKHGHRQPTLAAQAEATSVECSAQAAVEKLEVRIFDFAREVEACMQTRIAVLDRLIVDADREILRLQDLLAATKGSGGAGSLAGLHSDPRSNEAPTGGKMPLRQPDVLVPPPPPAAVSEREAA